MLIDQLPTPPFAFHRKPAVTSGQLSALSPFARRLGLSLFSKKFLQTVPLSLFKDLQSEPDSALAAVPGNTAKAHGRPFSTWLFFKFTPGAANQDQLLGDFIYACYSQKYHTDLLTQLNDWQDYKKLKDQLALTEETVPDDDPVATKPFGTIMLTGRSLAILDPTQTRYGNFVAPDFKVGMPAGRGGLGDCELNSVGDPAADPWMGYGFEEDFAIALFLARNTRAGCDELVQDATQLAAQSSLTVAQREDGFTWQPDGPDTTSREPFGFQDGLSNLLFLKDDVDKQKTAGVTAWEPQGGWDNVLYFPDENETVQAVKDLEGGSFVVLRKLEQNVRAFYDWEAAQPPLLPAPIPGAEPGSQLIGRTRDGCPLTGMPANQQLNNFNYEADLDGQRCPFFAHIRKANARGSSAPPPLAASKTMATPRAVLRARRETDERPHLFVRRGMIYAPGSTLTRADRPTTTTPASRDQGVGLLFTAYMGNIERQFGFMQTAWLMNRTFPTDKIVGGDPISAQTYEPPAPTPGLPRGFVIPRGGGYFFAPPIPWVKKFAPPALAPFAAQHFAALLSSSNPLKSTIMSKEPFIDPEFLVMSSDPKNPRGRITAVRIANIPGAGAKLFVDADDRLDGEIWKNGVKDPGPANELGRYDIPAGSQVTVTVKADTQGLVAISRAGWFPDCEIVHLLSLGTLFPLDFSDDAGMSPIGRRLFWKATANPTPPAKTISFQISATGVVTWTHLNISCTLDLRLNSPEPKYLHLALLTRNGETGGISVPAYGNNAELRFS